MSRLQIDMVPVGDSDAFLMEVQMDAEREVILIDGGRNWEDGDRVLRHLDAYYGGRIDHLILSHIDADHAAGMLHVVENLPPERMGQAWIQDMNQHGVDVQRGIQMARQVVGQAQSTSVRTVATHLADSVEGVQRLLDALKAKGVPVQEAFADRNNRIGPLEVLGPTEAFFESCIKFYGDIGMLGAMVEHGVSFKRRRASSLGPTDADQVLSAAIDDPEMARQASLILLLEYEGDKYLCCGDAGRAAFAACPQPEKMRSLHWLKVPNHGSKHNLSPELLDLFKPALVYISTSGIAINPHPDLISALKNRGAVVYSTSRSGNVWHRRGDVPPRTGYETRRPL